MSPQTKPVKMMKKHLKSWINLLVTLVAFFLATPNVSAQASDSIPFLFRGYNRGYLYIPVTINDSINCNVVFDTGASDLFGVDSVFLPIPNGNQRTSITPERVVRLEKRW